MRDDEQSYEDTRFPGHDILNVNARFSSFSLSFSLSPSLSFSLVFTHWEGRKTMTGSKGLPVCVQVVALPYKDELVLRAMKVIEGLEFGDRPAIPHIDL